MAVRKARLTYAELGVHKDPTDPVEPIENDGDMSEQLSALPESDPVYKSIKDALLDGYAGVILRGPPGTSKSWYAKAFTEELTSSDPDASSFIQFHPSYQYEDFIEGWVPDGKGDFKREQKAFLKLCEKALKNPSKVHVLVIDEISRCDAARVFGEALTYLETSKRGMKFNLASGTPVSVPRNLIVIGTMNPWDRGVDEVDFALLRRFAQIDMPPRVEVLKEMLAENGLIPLVIDKLAQFFSALQKNSNPMLHIGHAYFKNAKSCDAAQRVWDLQLSHHFRSVCRLEPDELRKIENMWVTMVMPVLRPEIVLAPGGQAAAGDEEQASQVGGTRNVTG